MKAVDFDYARAASIDETCRLLAGAKGEAKIIAGGQTLVPLLAMRLTRPALLIDINGIVSLQGIEMRDGAVTIRACTRQADALAHAEIRARLPLLAKALGFVGHVQTRNRGTIGGSLANADPSAEIGLACLALDCQIVARRDGGERVLSVGDFFLGPMTTALKPEECLTEIRFPAWRERGRIGTGFKEISIRRSDFALVAVSCQLVLGEDGVCRRLSLTLGGVGSAPLIADELSKRLTGTRLETRDIEKALASLQETIEPQSDLHVSADYRRRVIGVLAARAIAEAQGEAMAGGA
ncbi:MAG: FAD binding domain-containing protein [Stellaceae bacterium]|jgi:CO/xanthine dehydrogenase FAD-binding subunit